jgi:nicotinamidase-related amidase
MATMTVQAEPYPYEFDPVRTALLVIDMQRDFVDPGGFGEALGNDVSLLRRAVAPIQRVLEAARASGIFVIHTREGHRPDLSDLPEAKRVRGHLETGIGDVGPMGRILVRGEYGHGIVDELQPLPSEPVVDKPGKGSFYATDLDGILHNRDIKSLIVTGVTAEVCVQTTVREANDRGYECLVLADCIASYFPEFYEMTIKMVKAQGGIFGWVSPSAELLRSLETAGLPTAARTVAGAR